MHFILTGIYKTTDTRNIFKKINDEVSEDIFDMSNVRNFKEIEKKNWGCLYFVLSSVIDQLS